jgi:hypothetical protein
MRSSALRVPERDRLLELEDRVRRLATVEPQLPTIAERFAPELDEPDIDAAELRAERPGAVPPYSGGPRPGRALIAGLIAGALLPTIILGTLLWNGTIRFGGADGVSAPAATAAPSAAAAPDIVLASPHNIEARAGEEVAFPITIDSTEPLPPRSLIAVSAMPDGASFSEGRPYGATGWSLRPDEIGDLRLRLPAGQSGASDMRIAFLAADGTQLAQAETKLNVAAEPADAQVALPQAESGGTSAVAQPETGQDADAPAESEASTPVANTDTAEAAGSPAGQVQPARDAVTASGDAAATAQVEWVEVVSPVDVHAEALQQSETVRVVPKGLKLRVAGRDKNWVQVSDPATSETGWIYNRFLKATEPPSQ